MLLEAARSFSTAGCCVVPARADGSKAPAVKWEKYQLDLPDDDQLERWFSNGSYDGFGVVCGAVSGGLEMLEIEGRATELAAKLQVALAEHGLAELWARLCSGYLERTPSGGLHWLYRVEGEVRRNTKLARRPASADELESNPADRIKVMIETRGEGGFTITAPSAGRTHPTGLGWAMIIGGPDTIPTLTEFERDALHDIARLFDQMPVESFSDDDTRPAPASINTGELRPGDDFNERATWDEILPDHGWVRTRKNFAGTGAAWTRPGKDHGVSATTGTASDGVDRLYVFSSSTEFDPERPYSKFAAYAVLNHGGDHAVAARTLRADGYGSPATEAIPGLSWTGPPPGAATAPGGQPPSSAVDEPPADDGRPWLDVGNPATMADWLRAELGVGPLAGMFIRGPEIVHTPQEGEEGYVELVADLEMKPAGPADGPAQVRAVSRSTLASRVQVIYRCYRTTAKGAANPALFPIEAARVATDVPDMMLNLRRLCGVVHSPIFRPDGSLISHPGYDVETGLLHLPEPGLVVPEVADRPDAGDVEAAVKLLDTMTREFNFVTEHDKANYYGLLLTPLLRTLTPPPYKLVGISSPAPGSGKTLLATAARLIHGGVFRAEVPEDDAELRKQITAMLTVTTGPVIHFDNVSGILRSSTLAGLLTSDVWGDRPLGATEWVGIPNDRVWVITGNNLVLGGDLVRRTLWVTIDPGVPNPELRTGFAIKDLESWVKVHRGELLHALLTLIRSWVINGRQVDHERGSDGYARWTETVAAILQQADVPGTYGHADSARQSAGFEDDDWGEFLEAIYEVFGTERWSVKELLQRVNTSTQLDAAWIPADRPIPLTALPSELADKVTRSQAGVGAVSKSLGHWLRNRDGRWAGRLTIRTAGERRARERLWRIESARPPTANNAPHRDGRILDVDQPISGDIGDNGDFLYPLREEKSYPITGQEKKGRVEGAGELSPMSPMSPSPDFPICAAPACIRVAGTNSTLCDPCLARARGETP